VLGVSFGELVMIGVVALVVVGPRRLPEMLGSPADSWDGSAT
jgi:Sec-independent protein translocase protein TatA